MSAWLPGLIMGIEREEADASRERQKEYLAALEKMVVEEKRKLCNTIIEECARVAMRHPYACGETIATAIRGLKDKT